MTKNARPHAALALPLLLLLAALCPAAVSAQTPPANQWEAEIRKFEESDRVQPPPPGAVLFVGSSSVRLWQSLVEDFPGVKVINRGFGGSQIADSTFYADRIVVPYKPRMVVLYAGDNDLAAGRTPRQVFEDYKAFVARVSRELPQAKIAFISIKPSPSRAALLPKVREANGLIRDYVSRDKRLAYIDVFTPMMGADGSPRPELFGPDMLHMNREGYLLWKSVVAPYLR
jgi:lysophospholipase L1-like esterase